MLAQEEEVEAEVRQEDQQEINEFGKNNARLAEVTEELNSLKQKLETFDDASTDLMMGDGEPVSVLIGSTFVKIPEEEAGEYIEELVAKAQDKVTLYQKEESELLSRQDALKKLLYGRFGSSINLEA